MISPDYEKLFLLEALVDEVYISQSNLSLDQDTRSSLKETCVTFQFLHYPPLVVCEEDFFKSPSNKSASHLNFKSGKSCLFSIQSSEIQTLPYKFDINVSILRKIEPKGKMVLGTSVINLGDSFTALMQSSASEPDFPLQKTKTGRFDVSDDDKRIIGYINAFLRLSCYGHLIVTQFQVGAAENTFMFKGTEPKEVVEIPGDSTKMPKIQLDPNYSLASPIDSTNIPKKQLDPNSTFENQFSKAEQPQLKLEPSGDGDMKKDETLVPFRHHDPMIPHPYNYEQPPQPIETPGTYKEIIAEIKGCSLRIRISTKSKIKSTRKSTVCKYKQLDLCDCDFPVPPEAIPRCRPCS